MASKFQTIFFVYLNMIGIYKIVSPTGRVYVGQSINIARRFNDYIIYNKNMSGRRLKYSFDKYGVENHIFSIITECRVDELNFMERHYQEKFNCIDREKGLNCQLVNCEGKKRLFSDLTIEKMRKASAGKIISEETKIKIKIAKKGKCSGEDNGFFGKHHSDFTKKMVSEHHKSKGNKPIPRYGAENNKSRLLLDTVNGVYFDTIKEACTVYGFKRTTLNAMLTGQNINKTNLIYV